MASSDKSSGDSVPIIAGNSVVTFDMDSLLRVLNALYKSGRRVIKPEDLYCIIVELPYVGEEQPDLLKPPVEAPPIPPPKPSSSAINQEYYSKKYYKACEADDCESKKNVRCFKTVGILPKDLCCTCFWSKEAKKMQKSRLPVKVPEF